MDSFSPSPCEDFDQDSALIRTQHQNSCGIPVAKCYNSHGVCWNFLWLAWAGSKRSIAAKGPDRSVRTGLSAQQDCDLLAPQPLVGDSEPDLIKRVTRRMRDARLMVGAAAFRNTGIICAGRLQCSGNFLLHA